MHKDSPRCAFARFSTMKLCCICDNPHSLMLQATELLQHSLRSHMLYGASYLPVCTNVEV